MDVSLICYVLEKCLLMAAERDGGHGKTHNTGQERPCEPVDFGMPVVNHEAHIDVRGCWVS
jgi:hypothetical protein